VNSHCNRLNFVVLPVIFFFLVVSYSFVYRNTWDLCATTFRRRRRPPTAKKNVTSRNRYRNEWFPRTKGRKCLCCCQWPARYRDLISVSVAPTVRERNMTTNRLIDVIDYYYARNDVSLWYYIKIVRMLWYQGGEDESAAESFFRGPGRNLLAVLSKSNVSDKVSMAYDGVKRCLNCTRINVVIISYRPTKGRI